MIVPAVYTFMGTEGMSAGPGLMFVSLPKIFEAMGAAGPGHWNDFLPDGIFCSGNVFRICHGIDCIQHY